MKITARGQVTIPVAIRERLGLLPQTEVEVVVEQGHAVIRKVPSGGRGAAPNAPVRARRKSAPSPKELLARIAVDPTVRFGKPCVRGTRILVGEVFGALATGLTEAEVLREFPQLTHEDVLACFAFAADRP